MKFSNKHKIVFLTVCVMLAAAIQALAADFNGKWVAQVPGQGGQTRETTFTFKVEGDKVTGTISGRQGDTPIADGKVSGDDISFTVTREIQGNTIKMTYKGKYTSEGIKFTRTIE